MSLDGVEASGTGGFGNLGREWIWRSGIGVNVGAGVAHLAGSEATDGLLTIRHVASARPPLAAPAVRLGAYEIEPGLFWTRAEALVPAEGISLPRAAPGPTMFVLDASRSMAGAGASPPRLRSCTLFSTRRRTARRR